MTHNTGTTAFFAQQVHTHPSTHSRAAIMCRSAPFPPCPCRHDASNGGHGQSHDAASRHDDGRTRHDAHADAAHAAASPPGTAAPRWHAVGHGHDGAAAHGRSAKATATTPSWGAAAPATLLTDGWWAMGRRRRRGSVWARGPATGSMAGAWRCARVGQGPGSWSWSWSWSWGCGVRERWGVGAQAAIAAAEG